jgi:hypothetical protein
LGEGRFQWGYVLTTLHGSEGIECSPLVAALVSNMKAEPTVEVLLESLQRQFSSMNSDKLKKDLLATISILYTDGVIERLKD